MEPPGGTVVGDGPEGRAATPTASRPIMSARQGSIAEVDHTCFRVVRVNELLFVYLGLIFGQYTHRPFRRPPPVPDPTHHLVPAAWPVLQPR